MSDDPILAALARLEAGQVRLHRDIDALRTDVMALLRHDVMTLLRKDIAGRLTDLQNIVSDMHDDLAKPKDDAP